MGQGGSKTQVHVHIDKPFYYAGDIVTGFVVLHAETAMTFNSINLKVQHLLIQIIAANRLHRV
jgi:hypothetical protein